MMFFLGTIWSAARSLRSNFLRSILAILGIIFGVGTVIAAVGVINGATHDVLQSFQSAGSNVLWIQPGGGERRGRHQSNVAILEIADVEAVRASPLVLAAAPELITGDQVKYAGENRNVLIMGTDADFCDVFDYRPARGSFFGDDAVIGARKVAVLGAEIAEKLFGKGRSAVGEEIRVGRWAFRVIGVMEEKGLVGFRDFDMMVYIPISRSQRMYNPRSLTSIAAAGVPYADQADVKDSISAQLRRAHRLQIGEEDDFQITTLKEAFQQFKKTTDIFKGVFFAISGISLVVGGFGIMNIMLVSVTERTREIGVRMAIGAQRWDILLQFLAESSMICLVGAPLGIAMGALTIEAIKKPLAPLKPIMTADVVALAVVVAIITGIVSGFYPAWRASRLDPVEALRYE